MMTGDSGHALRIQRTYAASAEDVFDAWTSPEVMRRWFHCARDWQTPEAEVDLRVGGWIRVVMRTPDGKEVEAQGQYRLIDRPHRLVMTWTFDDDPLNEQLIELSFSEAGNSTTVLMVNSGIATDQRRDAQHEGWQGCLDDSSGNWTVDSARVGRCVKSTGSRNPTRLVCRGRWGSRAARLLPRSR